jgi:hypothetical protein
LPQQHTRCGSPLLKQGLRKTAAVGKSNRSKTIMIKASFL